MVKHKKNKIKQTRKNRGKGGKQGKSGKQGKETRKSTSGKARSVDELLKIGNNRSNNVMENTDIRNTIFSYLRQPQPSPEFYSPVYQQDGDIRKEVTVVNDLRRPIYENIKDTIVGANLKPNELMRLKNKGIETTAQLIGIVFQYIGPDMTKNEVEEELLIWLKKVIFN